MNTINKIKTRNELADFLKVPRRKLSYILYVKGVDNLYTSFDISKKAGGVRHIHAPQKDLKLIQKKLADALYIYQKEIWKKNNTNSNISHAFQKGRSFITNEAYFTVLETALPISRQWLNALIYDHDNSMKFAPDVWKRFINQGRNGIVPLIAKKLQRIPTRYDQLQSDMEGKTCLKFIRDHYVNNAYGFEMCAKNILEKMDERFQDFSLTRPWRDGGRDALGYYVIGNESKANYPLRIDCAMEAKCYAENHSVGVREMEDELFLN